jgi:WD40 repeat protein
MALSPDGAQLAVGATTGLTLLDAATLEVVRVIPLPFAATEELVWAADGIYTLRDAKDETMLNTIHHIDPAGRIIAEYESASGIISPDATTVLSGNGTLTDLQTGERLTRITTGDRNVIPGSWLPDSERILLGSVIVGAEPGVTIVEAATGEVIAELATDGQAPSAVAVQGERLALVTFNNTLEVWSTTTWQRLWSAPVDFGEGYRRHLLWQGDDLLAFSGDENATDRAFRFEGSTGALLDWWNGPPLQGEYVIAGADGVLFSLTPDAIYSYGEQLEERVWQPLGTALAYESFPPLQITVQITALNPAGTLFATASHTHTTLWAVPSGERVTTLPRGWSAVAWSPDGERIALVKRAGVSVHNPTTGEGLTTYAGPAMTVPEAAAWLGDERIVVAGQLSGTWERPGELNEYGYVVLNATTGEELSRVVTQAGTERWETPRAITSPDGARVVLVQRQGDSIISTITIIGADGAIVAKNGWRDHRIESVTWSPEGGRLAFSSEQPQPLRAIIDANTAEVITELSSRYLAERLSPLAWAPDGQTVAGVGFRGGAVGARLYRWDATTGEQVISEQPIGPLTRRFATKRSTFTGGLLITRSTSYELFSVWAP